MTSAAGHETAPTAGDESLTPAMIAVALGVSTLRLELLRAFMTQSHATVSELMEVTGCTRGGLRPHLQALEQFGALHSEILRIPGVFRPTRVYHVDRGKVEEIAWSVYDAVIVEASDALQGDAP